MSDVLALLAARTLGLMPTLRPLVTPRYASPPPGLALAPEDAAAAAPAGDGAVAERSPRPPGAAQARTAPTAGREASAAAADAAAASVQAPAVAPRPASAMPAGVVERNAEAVQVQAQPLGRQPPREAQERGSLERAVGSEPGPGIRQLLAAGAADGSPRLEAAVREALAGRTANPGQRAVSPEMPPVFAKHESAAAGAAGTAVPNLAPLPTIQVTIGRIEVRAAPPAPARPAPRRAPASPAPSLDEYLKRGSGGKP